MQLDVDIEIIALMGVHSNINRANYALVVNHTSKTYVRVDVMNKSVVELFNVFSINPYSSSLQRFKDVKEFKKKYPKYK